MARRFLFLILLVSFMLILPVAASAQMNADDDEDDDNDDNDDNDDDDNDATDDDDAADELNATLEFVNETGDELVAEEYYEFEIHVINNEEYSATEKGEWIYKVELSMPSTAYAVELDTTAEYPIPVPDAKYEDTDHWESEFDPSSSTITWQSFGVVTSANYGDIREGDMMVFNFIATTDEEATDGFHWMLYSDEGTEAEGVAYYGSGDDDDDDDNDDLPPSGDDDDDSGGCGC